MKIDCGHHDVTATGRVCTHISGSEDLEYERFFTGVGQHYELVCFACAEASESDSWERSTICSKCFASIEEEGYWSGIVGQPEIRRQESSYGFVHRLVSIEGLFAENLLDIKSIDCATDSIWIALDRSGILLKIDCENQSFSTLPQTEQLDLNFSNAISINVSQNGNFVAVTETLGERGVVIDLTTGRVALRLQRDNYHSDVSCFPVAFFMRNGKELLVHGTAWNRLDISDPATGVLLTERSFLPSDDPKERPEHYLDYFHGHLLVSPNQEWIADNGWAWSPAGIVMAWNLRHWIESNRWESEDGESKKRLCQRLYFWDGPSCWIDDQTLAVWGYGEDDEWLIPAVRLFDIASESEVTWFAGPQVALSDKASWTDKLAKRHGLLIFDRYLFALSQKYGISVWDTALRACLLEDSSFAPLDYHRGSKEFLSFTSEGAIQLSRLMGNK